MITQTEPLPAESTHWYSRSGEPMYEVQAKNGSSRPTTLADARKLDLVPSVTAILSVAAKPGLEAWKARQVLEASLTLPMLPEETLDGYALRVMEDAKAQSKKARDKGTELHAAIENWIANGSAVSETEWLGHIMNVAEACSQHGVELLDGSRTEHSFASSMGYAGKIDWHNSEPLILDFKTKQSLDNKKQLAWPEHVQQLAAYGFGLWSTNFRAINVFIGTQDKQVRVIEHEWPDIVEGFEQFRCLLEYWHRIKRFGPYAQ